MLDQSENLPAGLRKLSDIVDEYDRKREGIPAALQAYRDSITALNTAACIGGTYGGAIWERSTPDPYPGTVESVLLKSAWKHVIEGLNIREIATAKDISALELSLSNPPPFTLDNIRASLGHYLTDPRGHMLRGVAEAFCDLDPAYRSHSKVKIGVQGLPKRIILTGVFLNYGEGWRAGQCRNILDAMAALNVQPKMTYSEWSALYDAAKRGNDPSFCGVTMRGFANGNAHLIFDPDALLQINRALAEYYGDVLPDTPDEAPKKRTGTALATDLQYYPTPKKAAESLINGVRFNEGDAVLEPSCGDGRLMDALQGLRKGLRITGVECHPERAAEARAKGHHVQTANFLQIAPRPIFDKVVMNPPFFGKHYLKHIRHALEFLKPGGVLVSILPASAHYDHGELPPHGWDDFPVGSFSESGTNVPTGIATITKRG